MRFIPAALSVSTILGVGLWVGGVAHGQNQELVFRTGVDLVTVDATVLDRDGRPNPNLTVDDFVLKVDGQPRRLLSAHFVEQRPSGDRPASLFARHFSSNEFADAGRLLVVAVDEAHIRRTEGRSALAAAGNFLDRLSPLDRVAVTGLSRLGTMHFTRDRAESRRLLEGLTGQTDPVFLTFNLGLSEAIEIADGGRARLAEVVLRECGRPLTSYTSPTRALDDAVDSGRDACPEQLEQEARAMSQYARSQARMSLSSLLALAEGLKRLDGPKTIVLLSEGMVLDPRMVDIGPLATAAREARVAIYVLQMETPMFEAAQLKTSPTFLRDLHVRSDGLEFLAGATRGAVFRLVGSDPRPFDRVATEISGYYLLAFEPRPDERDGKLHRIDVSLARGGGLVRSRSNFRLSPVVTSTRSRQEELERLLRGSAVASELPLRVATYTYQADGDRLRVVVSAETDAADDLARVLMGYVLTDGANVIAASGVQLAEHGRQSFSTVVPAGKYTLRVAGIDLLERRGFVERPFVAALGGTAAVRVSDLILAPAVGSAAARLQPLVDRVSGRQVMANLEVYGPSQAEVLFEIEGRPAVRATMAAGSGLSVARAVIPLTELPAGAHTIHARVLVGGSEVTRVSRPFTLEP